MDFSEVVDFHGHVCPGLAMGYRVAMLAVDELDFTRAGDEELVAVVENNSCAVDAIQAVAGCTFGKGNLIFMDHGKQVYTFFKRSTGESLRIAVVWQPPAESDEVAAAWKRFRAGDRAPEIVKTVQRNKAAKANAILDADAGALFACGPAQVPLPQKASVYPSVTCSRCGEKVMAPKALDDVPGGPLCIPCGNRQG